MYLLGHGPIYYDLGVDMGLYEYSKYGYVWTSYFLASLQLTILAAIPLFSLRGYTRLPIFVFFYICFFDSFQYLYSDLESYDSALYESVNFILALIVTLGYHLPKEAKMHRKLLEERENNRVDDWIA